MLVQAEHRAIYVHEHNSVIVKAWIKSSILTGKLTYYSMECGIDRKKGPFLSINKVSSNLRLQGYYGVLVPKKPI